MKKPHSAIETHEIPYEFSQLKSRITISLHHDGRIWNNEFLFIIRCALLWSEFNQIPAV